MHMRDGMADPRLTKRHASSEEARIVFLVPVVEKVLAVPRVRAQLAPDVGIPAAIHCALQPVLFLPEIFW